MYIINNIDRPLGINTYGVLKKYLLAALGNMLPALANATRSVSWLNSLVPTTTLVGLFFGGSEVKGQKEVDEHFKNYAKNKVAKKKDAISQSNKQLQKQYNLSKVTLKDGKYYDALNNYIGNSSGISQGAYNYLLNKYGKTLANMAWKAMRKGATYENGLWIYPENKSTGGDTPQRPRLDPNRFVSIYDTTGLWKQHAQDNNLTDRDSVRRFLKEVLGFDDTLADGIWGKNTNAAYEDWKLKNSTPVVETVTTQTVLAPTVYQSTYDYDNADDFKNLGFNDYNSLKSWVKANPDHPFAKDMLERFKDIDLWTQNNIESNLGIKGKYRSGYQGDLYDIRNSMKNYFKDLYNIDKNNEYTTQILLNVNNMNNYVQNLANRFSFLKKQFKNGGQLVSRNPIKRFKDK